MVYSGCMKFLLFLLAMFAVSLPSFAQEPAQTTPKTAVASADDYSGMYSFLKEGEFIQITIEDKRTLSGFISRLGDSAADKGSFLDQFLKSGKVDGEKVSFTTESVHGVWFTFDGSFGRGPGKKPEEEAYYVVRGTLTRFETDAQKKTSSQARQVEFKSFPIDAEPAPH
jgi:hypothetical protein